MKNLILAYLIFLSPTLIAQIQIHNDEFDNELTLDANWININDEEEWNAEHLEVHDINQSTSGKLHMMPWTSSWYQDYQGTLIFKNIDQDFVFTTNVDATNRAENNMPGPNYSLAGVMVRIPRDYPNGATGGGGWTTGGENYVFLSAGFAATNHPSCGGCPGPHFEVKNTVSGISTLQVSSISHYEDINIRVARVDTAIIVLYQLPGEDWQVRERYDRSDFSAEIQVGFVTYTDWNKVNTYDEYFHNSHVLNTNLNPDPSSNPGLPFNPDLIGKFDFARYDVPEVPPGLNGVDLVSQATDNELLSFLGYDTESYCPDTINVIDHLDTCQIAIMNAAMEITAQHQVDSCAQMTYSATNGIELLNGFEAILGSEISINLDGCN
jgi:hypothetical protein